MKLDPARRRRYLLFGGGAGALILFLIVAVLLSSFVLNAGQSVAALFATPTPAPTATPLPTPTATPVPFVNGTAEYLADAQSGTPLYASNSHAHLPMASTTKIMTAIVAIEHADLMQVVPVTQQELNEVPAGVSTALLQAGDRIRLSDLLYGLLLPSGSDAAIVIAHAVAGNTPAFVAMMNSEAQQLGLHDTHYTSPHGALSDSNHYTSAADLVTLARYAMRNAFFAEIVRQPMYELHATINHHDYVWTNTNPLLGNYPGADGVKTGSSDDAGYCLVFSATRNGRRLIGAELGAPSSDTVFADAKKLLDLGFSKFIV